MVIFNLNIMLVYAFTCCMYVQHFLKMLPFPEMTFKGTSHGWLLPVLPMLLSLPLWAIIVSQMCFNWSYYTLLTSLPTYMDNILHFDLKSVKLNSVSY